MPVCLTFHKFLEAQNTSEYRLTDELGRPSKVNHVSEARALITHLCFVFTVKTDCLISVCNASQFPRVHFAETECLSEVVGSVRNHVPLKRGTSLAYEGSGLTKTTVIPVNSY